ncbi:MAG: hypothetical protein C5B55_08965 [Blastocatellia bacterium]|nr:MAG: hypothetical protein C5B55_08965 [Blastocatellia bacterium]
MSISLIVCLGASLVVSQTPEADKPKLKNFGSSLDQLQWDARRNEAVEVGPGRIRTKKMSDDDVVRIETTLVINDVLVVSAQGQTITGLTERDFLVTEDGEPQKVGVFALGDNSNIPRSIVLIIDYSISQFPFISSSIAAAEKLVDKLAPRDRMAIVTDDVELLSDFTNDRKELKDKLESLLLRATSTRHARVYEPSRRFGRSSQYSALMATLREAFDSEDQRPIIIFQTDGDEAYYLRNPIVGPQHISPDLQQYPGHVIELLSKDQREKLRNFSVDDVYKTVEQARVTIYTVVPGFRLVGRSPEEQAQQIKLEWSQRSEAWVMNSSPEARSKVRREAEKRWSKLSRETVAYQIDRELKIQSALAGIAGLTGGWTAFLGDASQAEKIYSRILDDMNRRYIVGYYPTNKERDGHRRKTSITVRGHPEYTVMTRTWYWAPANH